MQLALPLLAFAALVLSGESPTPEPTASIDEWVPVDDPSLTRLPVPLRRLVNEEQAVFEYEKKPWLLIARRLSASTDAVAAFAADEKSMAGKGKFIPVDESYMNIRGTEAAVFECEWEHSGVTSRILAMYAAADDDTLQALWIIAPEKVTAKALLIEIKACRRALLTGLKPPTENVYESILNGHALSFALRMGRGRKGIAFADSSTTQAADLAAFKAIAGAKDSPKAAIARDWIDEPHEVSLSYQIVQADTGLGPRHPFMIILADRLQTAVRRNKDDGDAPIHLLHVEAARTVVVSDAEVERHYENNRRAPENGVILKTFLPRSPFARACRMRWVDKESGRHSLAMFFELRTYPRSRSETVTRTAVAILIARANSIEELNAVEEGIEFSSKPLTEEAPLAALPH